MPPAFTLYKLRKMIGLVFVIFFLLAVWSVLKPELNKALGNAIKEVDETGAATEVLEATNTVPNPKAEAEQEAGNFLYKLLTENPKALLVLVFVVAFILFVFGVRLRSVRKYQRDLLR